MSETTDFQAGGYRFINGVFQYSAGVAALPGHKLVRVRFRDPMPLKEGFERIADHIRAAGRPLTSFAACELRSPAPFTETGFREFNEVYVVTLEKWGIYNGATRINPVARSNVCPPVSPPPAPAFHAFTYAVKSAETAPSFVIAGSGEAQEGGASYQERTIRYRDTSPDAMREKARFVLGQMEKRMAAIGQTWAATTAVQVYTVHDLHPFLADEIVKRGAARHGLTWHYCRPPVVDLEYEMDCRCVADEHVI